MAILSIDEKLCNGCEVCIESCPTDVIRFDEKKKIAFFAYPVDCCTCYLCERDCVPGAIKISPELSRPFIPPF